MNKALKCLVLICFTLSVVYSQQFLKEEGNISIKNEVTGRSSSQTVRIENIVNEAAGGNEVERTYGGNIFGNLIDKAKNVFTKEAAKETELEKQISDLEKKYKFREDVYNRSVQTIITSNMDLGSYCKSILNHITKSSVKQIEFVFEYNILLTFEMNEPLNLEIVKYCGAVKSNYSSIIKIVRIVFRNLDDDVSWALLAPFLYNQRVSHLEITSKSEVMGVYKQEFFDYFNTIEVAKLILDIPELKSADMAKSLVFENQKNNKELRSLILPCFTDLAFFNEHSNAYNYAFLRCEDLVKEDLVIKLLTKILHQTQNGKMVESLQFYNTSFNLRTEEMKSLQSKIMANTKWEYFVLVLSPNDYSD